MWIRVYPIEKQNLILIMVERDVFFCNQRLNIIYPNEGNVLMVPNHERTGDYYVNLCFSHYQMNFTSKENGGKKAFQTKPKNQCLLSQ